MQKEFFMLLIRELLNPDFGMFYEEEESKYIWFRQQVCNGIVSISFLLSFFSWSPLSHMTSSAITWLV